MPWTGPQFASRFNHGISPVQAVHASRVANAIVRRGAPDGLAIATANARVHRDTGGMVPNGMMSGIAPTGEMMNPIAQNLIGRFQSMTPEQLQEMSVRLRGTPYGQIAGRVLQYKHTMPAQAQPVQAPTGAYQPPPPAADDPQQQAQQQQDAQAQMRAGGGIRPRAASGMSISAESPWWARSEERAATDRHGLLASPIAGRTDEMAISPASGSYVVPADVISGIGEGNSTAGANVMQRILETGPEGLRMRPPVHRNTIPRPPPAYREGGGGGGATATSSGFARGGKPDRKDGVPILAAGGEFVISPQHVARLGDGDVREGHRRLDHWVVATRKHIIHTMRGLKPPVKS